MTIAVDLGCKATKQKQTSKVIWTDRLEKPGIALGNPGLQGEWFIRYTTASPKGEAKKVSSPSRQLCIYV